MKKSGVLYNGYLIPVFLILLVLSVWASSEFSAILWIAPDRWTYFWHNLACNLSVKIRFAILNALIVVVPLAVIVWRIRRYTLRLRGAKSIAGWSLLFAAVCGMVLLLLSWRFPYGLETEAVWSLLWRNFAWNLEVKFPIALVISFIITGLLFVFKEALLRSCHRNP